MVQVRYSKRGNSMAHVGNRKFEFPGLQYAARGIFLPGVSNGLCSVDGKTIRRANFISPTASEEKIRLFCRKVAKAGNCWIWTAGKERKGYGVFWDGYKLKRAHRFSYFALVAIYAFIRASQSVEQIIDSIIDKDKK